MWQDLETVRYRAKGKKVKIKLKLKTWMTGIMRIEK